MTQTVSALKDLIQFCESKQLGEVVKGLKEQLDSETKNKQVDTLRIIKDALVKEERRQAKETKNTGKVQKETAPLKTRTVLPFNKEENEVVMENLMNRIVSKS